MLIANVLKTVIASFCLGEDGLGEDGHRHRAPPPLSAEGCREEQITVV